MQRTHYQRKLESSRQILDIPAPSEVEISLFGPGYGESVAIHATQGNWIIVDSCFSPHTNASRPIQYLKQIGVDIGQSVKLIVATHWDDDHIAGLAECVRECRSAKFAISAAIYSEEFVTVIELQKQKTQKSPGVNEIAEALQMLDRERVKLALENTTLWTNQPEEHPTVRIVALSPSSAMVMDGHIAVATLMQQFRVKPIRSSFLANRNHRSIVLFIEAGPVTALLGADLEHTGDLRTGWAAILNNSVKYPKAQVFKIPHHGSEDADNPQVWNDLLTPNPPAILTPWRIGNRALPTQNDLTRLAGRSKRLYISTVPQNYRRKREPAVQHLLDAHGVRLHSADESHAQIRLRACSTASEVIWSEDLFGGAKHITGRMYKGFPQSF